MNAQNPKAGDRCDATREEMPGHNGIIITRGLVIERRGNSPRVIVDGAEVSEAQAKNRLAKLPYGLGTFGIDLTLKQASAWFLQEGYLDAGCDSREKCKDFDPEHHACFTVDGMDMGDHPERDTLEAEYVNGHDLYHDDQIAAAGAWGYHDD